jgi:hypothetical protein
VKDGFQRKPAQMLRRHRQVLPQLPVVDLTQYFLYTTLHTHFSSCLVDWWIA